MPSPDALLGHRDVAGQRRSAERAQVERKHDVPLGKFGGDARAELDLDAVALVIIDRQRDHREPLLARQPRADHRIEPARQQHDGRPAQSFSPSRGAAQNIMA